MSKKLSESERISWEVENNPPTIQVRDPLMGLIDVSREILIEPYAYSHGQQNAERRRLAIQQGTFKPAS